MSSANTTIGNALQFTNDNKHAYAYSGTMAVSAGSETALLFTTSSEYIIARIEISFDTTSLGTGEDIGYQIKLNDIEVVDYNQVLSTIPDNRPYSTIIIPPFAKFEGLLSTSDGSAINMGMTLTGKVGMPQRVGNLA